MNLENLVEEMNKRFRIEDDIVGELFTIFSNTLDEVLKDGGARLDDDEFDDVRSSITYRMVASKVN